MQITYPNLDSAGRPVPDEILMLIPISPKDGLAAFADEVEEDSDKGSIPAANISTDFEYDPEES